MRQSAEEIRQDMREEARAHAGRMAQRKARDTLDSLNAALNTPTLVMSKLLYQPAEKYNRQNVGRLLGELEDMVREVESLMTLLGELATPALLPDADQAEAPAAEERAA